MKLQAGLPLTVLPDGTKEIELPEDCRGQRVLAAATPDDSLLLLLENKRAVRVGPLDRTATTDGKYRMLIATGTLIGDAPGQEDQDQVAGFALGGQTIERARIHPDGGAVLLEMSHCNITISRSGIVITTPRPESAIQ